MFKQITTVFALMISAFTFSQVGIETETPQATLDVVGKPTDNSVLDGIIAPRLEGAQLRAKTYTSSQTGALVYVTVADTAPAGQTINVTAEGYYYFNGIKWVIAGGNDVNIYKDDGTLTSNRVVTQDNKTLTFSNGTGQSTTFTNDNGVGIVQSPGIAGRSSMGFHDSSGNASLWIYTDNNNSSQILASNNAAGLNIGTNFTVNPTPIMFQTSNGGGDTGTQRMIITANGNVGITNTNSVTEKLDVHGITRLRNLPLNNSLNAIFTMPDGNSASATQNQTFTATRTVVADANGVLGYVAGLAIPPTGFERLPNMSSTDFYWRLIGATTANYGTAGKYSVDASWNPANLSETIAGIPYSTILSLSGLSISDMGARGQNSFVAGTMNSASGAASAVFGGGNQASAMGTFAAGILNKATGDNAIAMGQSSQATGSSAIALGNTNLASAENSVAIGQANQATAQGTLALGNTNKATAISAIAMGQQNEANGQSSIAIGNTNIANGQSSVAIGHRLITSVQYSTAMGLFNKPHILPAPAERLFVLGNGTGETAALRSDAFTVLKNGKVGIDIDNFETTTSNAKLEVNGQIRVRPETTTVTCNAANEGSIRYFTVDANNGEFRGCKKTAGTFDWIGL